jgi:signal recognition particle subunit SRP54
LVGLQGSGKTTTVGKLARYLVRAGRVKRPLLVAADVYRPAAEEQLRQLGEQLGYSTFAVDGSEADPLAISKRAVEQAQAEGFDLVLLDTAGRLQIDEPMMAELEGLAAGLEPQEILLVADAMTGQEAVSIAQEFHRRLNLTGIILTKMDGDARGGAALSMVEVTGLPIKFIGVGERLDDLEPFHPERMASRILGMGDVLTLIEKAEAVLDEEEAERAARKIQKGEFTLEDFLGQFQAMQSMGPMKDILAMLPGAGSLLREVDIDDRDLKRVEAIIQSMTPDERRNPKIIGGSRKRRIASGSGTRPQDVNRVLKQFTEAQKMMKKLAGGKGIPSLEALTGDPRMKR